ncbi:MAG: hypothetical protein ACP5HM_05860 [Anaerolineae bacterium]
MARYYPSFEALELADQILDTIATHVPGYKGRIGAAWYWQMSGGVLVTFVLDYTATERRWDLLRAEAASPNVGVFNAADFPFAAYATVASSPPFIHDLDGEAEWSNRLYFQMGYLVEDAVLWLETLRATVIEPQIRPPAAFPALGPLERDLVGYALLELDGDFHLEQLYEAFRERISRRRLSDLAQRWADLDLLTEDRPRRVTVALRVLADIPMSSER